MASAASGKKKAGVESINGLCSNPDCRKPGARNLCSRCKRVVYCSRTCQKSHYYVGGHKEHCRPPARTAASVAAAAAPSTYLGEAVRSGTTAPQHVGDPKNP